MAIIHKIFCKYALIGKDLTLQQNVRIDINHQGKISNIKSNISTGDIEKDLWYSHHLLIPKFINSHTHLGDSVLKDQAFKMSLAEAVGPGGHKFQIKKLTGSQRIAAMRSALLEMIENGTSACYDFREGGVNGITELRKAAIDLPIDLHILGRQNTIEDIDEILSHSDGLGLSTPISFTMKELKGIHSRRFSHNILIATHIGEEPQVVQESLERFGISDLSVALKYFDPKILIHLTALKENELSKIPESKFIIFCPRSNAYFGLGFPPIDFFLNREHLIGLGTDNVMVIAPNILEELRWLILRLREQKTIINPTQALKLLTINPSKAFNLSTGCIQNGYWADLLVINLQSSRTSYGCDPMMTFLFRCQIPNDISLNLFHGEEISIDLNKKI
ncbi:MAG: amidohydrolase family protein [Candidatus Hodarchaeales archaeon]|jgi:cytosine/adenosine deaminase-related metal-dependent hydrolase